MADCDMPSSGLLQGVGEARTLYHEVRRRPEMMVTRLAGGDGPVEQECLLLAPARAGRAPARGDLTSTASLYLRKR